MLFLNSPFERVLRNEAGDGTDAGGASGETISREEIQELIKAQVGQSVNGAVTHHLAKQLPKVVKEEFSNLKLDEQFESLRESFKKQTPGNQDPKEPDERDNRIRELEQRLTTYETRIQETEEARKRGEQERVLAETRNEVGSLLKDSIRPEFLDVITRDIMSRVQVNEDGTVSMTSNRAPAFGLPEEPMAVSVADGIGDWLKAKDSDAFKPAPNSPGVRQPQFGRSPPAGELPPNATPQQRVEFLATQYGVDMNE